MRSLRGVGVLFSLLIVGVLGGVMVPHPLDAAGPTPPTLHSITMKVNNGTAVTVVTNTAAPVACPTTEFNWCFTIPTISAHGINGAGKDRTFTMKPNGSSVFVIGDFPGADQGYPKGIQIVPTVDATATGSGWTATEGNTVTITWTYSANSIGNFGQTCTNCTSNKNTAGKLYTGLISQGWWIALPCNTTCANTNLNNQATFSAKLNLSAANPAFINYNSIQDPVPTNLADANKPIYFQNKTTGTSTQFPLKQISTFPNADCRVSATDASLGCQATVTATLTDTTAGPDILKLNTPKVISLDEKLCFSPQGPPGKSLLIGGNDPCKNRSGKKTTDVNEGLDNLLTKILEEEVQFTQNQGAETGENCLPTDPTCPCVGPLCEGDIIHELKVTPSSYGLTFNFKASGNDMAPGYSITPVGNDGKESIGRKEFLGVGTYDANWTIEVDGFPNHPEANKKFDLNTINCVSRLYGETPTPDGTDWTEPTTSIKTGHEIKKVKEKDQLICYWHYNTTAK